MTDILKFVKTVFDQLPVTEEFCLSEILGGAISPVLLEMSDHDGEIEPHIALYPKRFAENGGAMFAAMHGHCVFEFSLDERDEAEAMLNAINYLVSQIKESS